MSVPLVYFAGKIAAGDWRHSIANVRSQTLDNYDGDERSAFAPLETYDGWCTYGGPFFQSCDHSCNHGPCQHGLLNDGCDVDNDRDKGDVVRLCRDWIERSDLMFVWLDAASAAGTVAEMGYAAACHIPVYLYEPVGFSTPPWEPWRDSATDESVVRLPGDDLWFVRELTVNKVVYCDDGVQEALRIFRRVCDGFKPAPKRVWGGLRAAASRDRAEKRPR